MRVAQVAEDVYAVGEYTVRRGYTVLAEASERNRETYCDWLVFLAPVNGDTLGDYASVHTTLTSAIEYVLGVSR